MCNASRCSGGADPLKPPGTLGYGVLSSRTYCLDGSVTVVKQ